MASSSSSSFHAIALILLFISKGTEGITFTVVNKCGYTIWPGILSNAGSNSLATTGFELPPGGSQTLQSPPNWSGRFWGRTGCRTDPETGRFACATGDCGSTGTECDGKGARPPATLAEFTIAAAGLDFYDVSLVDGYNLQVVVDPARGSGGACLSTGCVADLNRACPEELRAGDGSACMSACEAFGKPEYCCSGEFGSPATCKPSVYSQMFKMACPRSYSYAYDDPTSTFTCSGADYTITFCPTSSTSQKSARDTSPTSSSTSTSPSTSTSTSTMTSPSTSTSDGSEIYGTNTSTTGTEEGFPYVNSPWFPEFLSGDSSSTKLVSYSHLQAIITLLIVSIITLISS